MSAREYQVCVLGCGPSGFAAAMRAWDLGLSVCIVERGSLGGAGVHNGALSSKTLWELSRDYQRVLRTDRGFVADHVRVDYGQVCRAVAAATSEKVEHMERQIRELGEAVPGCNGGRLSLVRGSAKFIDAHTVQVEGTEPGEHWSITADHFVIATGSRPRALPNVPVDGHHVLTSDHVMRLDRFPRSLVVLGAGVVGCEFATIFANFGQTKVYVIDRADRILPFEDVDVARVCAANLEAKGVTVHHRAKLVDMRVHDEQVHYTIEHASGGRETIAVDHALISIGRVPNTESLDLPAAGIELDQQGYIVGEDCSTSQPHIFAVGDVTYDIALVNVGEIEGRHAAERIAGRATGKLSYDNLSTIMFLDPEVAAIGLNEIEAQKRRIPYRVAVYDYGLVNRAIAMRATDGFVKLLVTDDDDMRILGMRALGAHASTMLEAVSLMIETGRPARELAELLHPHPAVTEGLQECVRMLLGSSIYKPEVFRTRLRVSRVSYTDDGAPQTS
jgi:dihydrolipoamide dehydrogenase